MDKQTGENRQSETAATRVSESGLERLVSVKYRRWNFEADDNGLLVC